MQARQSIRTAHSRAANARQAVREFHAGVLQPDMELVVFFCSSRYDLDQLADEINRQFAGTRVVGCTTAGEIGPSGYLSHSLTGVSFSAAAGSAVTGFLDHLQSFELAKGHTFARSLRQALESRREDQVKGGNTFAFLLIDGLSVREEMVTRTFQNALNDIPLIGGSAGDDMKFSRTWIFHDGAFHTDAAALILLSTPYPFRVFKTQHFTSEAERLVVTQADVARRVVKEINGLPAAQEYARLVGIPVDQLTPACFAASPVVVLIDGTDYVRSIQKANPDGSLTFYSAIDEGLVFRVARGDNLVADLERTFASLREELGQPQVIFACDCILRDLETVQQGLKDKAGEVFRANNAVGFSTYGEQFCGMHVNQTLTGIAIGATPGSLHAHRGPEAEDDGPPSPQAHVEGYLATEIREPPGDEAGLRAEVTRLNKIIHALMNRAERSMGAQVSDFSLFQTAILLEKQVRTRTRELEAAEQENERINRDLQRVNQELEAFSYSVAHDLRAPLRTIDGFSRLLLEESAEELSSRSREYLVRVREGAQRMALLIDDLLHLSRCSRASLHREDVDLAALAHPVMKTLREAQPERRVEFRVTEHLPARGDPRLLTVLLENLLGNAWKYSRRQAVAHIELGFDPDSAAFYVRDDGAGFDMAYAGKLFQVFQRLHSPSEFEGTGVGLAIVHRIVERHGGRTWAQSRVNEGTTIYFTLPDSPG